MNFFWLSLTVALIIISAVSPDDIAVAFDLADVWIQEIWLWIRSLPLRVRLWLRLTWDSSWFAWRLWVIKQQIKHNRNNSKEGNE
jgi:membrane protein implicated in regulation of membrane protease activity